MCVCARRPTRVRVWIYSETCHLQSLHSATTWPLPPKFNAQTVLYRDWFVSSDHLVNATSDREILHSLVHSPAFNALFVSSFVFLGWDTAHFTFDFCDSISTDQDILQMNVFLSFENRPHQLHFLQKKSNTVSRLQKLVRFFTKMTLRWKITCLMIGLSVYETGSDRNRNRSVCYVITWSFRPLFAAPGA